MPDDDCDQPRARVRARCAGVSAATSRTALDGLGTLVRELRAEHGLAVHALARRGALDVRTVERVERAELRPRPSLLWALAWAVDPDEVDTLYGRLVAAAVPEVRPDTPGSLRVRAHRMNAAWAAGDVPVPVANERRARVAAVSWRMMEIRHALVDVLVKPLTAAESKTLSSTLDALGEIETALSREAGNFPRDVPLRRWRRGDPLDVPVRPPEGAGLAEIGQWAREWQIREGRRPPQTAQEKAIAATGAAERTKVRAYPELAGRLRWIPPQPGQRQQLRVIREGEVEPIREGEARIQDPGHRCHCPGSPG